MSAEPSPSHSDLVAFNDDLIAIVMRAEDILREVGRLEEENTGQQSAGEQSTDQEQSFRAAYEESSQLDEQVRSFALQIEKWQAIEMPVAHKSELDWALTKLNRLDVVTRNTLRICRRVLDIPDPEREQAEMMLMLNTMNISDEL